MKNTLFLALAVFLTTQASFADFRPGRVRVNSITDLAVISASGIYKNISNAKLEERITDGSPHKSYSLAYEGLSEPVEFKVVKVAESSCGDKITAESIEVDGANNHTILELVDMSNAACDIFVENILTVNLKTIETATGAISEAKMGGNPVYFMHTM